MQKILLGIVLFTFAFGLSAFTPNPLLTNMPENSWIKLGPEQGGTMQKFSGILAYSGAAYDPIHHNYVVFGGGHDDYWGNDVWLFDIETDTWEQQYAPGSISPAPASRHSYGFNCLVPNSVKEEDVGKYIIALLDNVKDEVSKRKSWRFKEKKSKKKEYRRRESPSGQKIKPLLDKALKNKR